MTAEEKRWLEELYECYVLPGKEHGSTAMQCTHWSRIAFVILKSNVEKIILSNDKHSALFLDGVLIDIEFNAFIVGFDWKSTAITGDARIAPINYKYPPETSQIYKFYSSPATEGYNLWHNKII
jgi:hypothetical protein